MSIFDSYITGNIHPKSLDLNNIELISYVQTIKFTESIMKSALWLLNKQRAQQQRP